MDLQTSFLSPPNVLSQIKFPDASVFRRCTSQSVKAELSPEAMAKLPSLFSMTDFPSSSRGPPKVFDHWEFPFTSALIRYTPRPPFQKDIGVPPAPSPPFWFFFTKANKS